MLRLDWTEVDLELEADGPWQRPEFPGPMWRGALASALRRLVCVMRRPICEGCPLVRACVYPRLFETRPDPAAGVMRRYDRAPHPMVIVAGLRAPAACCPSASARETLTVRLFGPDISSAPFLMRAVEEMAARGLGRARVPFRLTGIRTDGAQATPAGASYAPPHPRLPPPRLSLRQSWRLASPLRIVRDGRPVDAARIDGAAIGRAILRRVGLMAQFYGTLEPGVDFRALAEQADRVRLSEAALRWQPLRRWSSRQRAQQAIGGLVGTLALDFGEATDLAQLADWVPVVHLGKDTSMGLGQVIAEAA